MRTIAKSQRTVLNIKTATFRPFVFEGEEVEGQSFLQLDDTFPDGSGFHIYRMEPGSSSQPHEHTCHEQFLVLEGELIDNDGYVYQPGDFVLLRTGTQHSSRTETGATLAVFIRSPEKQV
jgi:anti-sigma factor ChrR (cupin superfamily)